MTASTDYYSDLFAEFFDLESITVLLVTGATPDEVAAALEVDTAAEPTEWPESADEDIELSDYALVPIDGGVLAIELSGYADPSRTALRTLTRGGRSAAVVRSNIQAHVRFGCARDGEVVFDDDEFSFIDETDRVPAELRPLFDLAWVDLDAEEGPDDDDAAAPFLVGLAMTEVFTGLRLVADDLARVRTAGYRPAPSLRYVADLE